MSPTVEHRSTASVVGVESYMPRPSRCTNICCPNAAHPHPRWMRRDGTYTTGAHGRVQRYRCIECGTRLSAQTESIHYFAKRRLNLKRVFERLRGGASMRDIARFEHCSPKAIANAVLRLGRQSMAAHLQMLTGLEHSGELCFDGLVSAVTSRDYPAQITTLADTRSELLLAMTHAVTERRGTRTAVQASRITRKRSVWKPGSHELTSSIALLSRELPRFACSMRLRVDTDEHPLYRRILLADRGIQWFDRAGLFAHRRTPGGNPRTTRNPLFIVNYLDRMIRHRMKEHTRESIAIARNATMQMHRMWIFAWDHNACQPRRVRGKHSASRAQIATGHSLDIDRLQQVFFARRIPIRRRMPESMRKVWLGELCTPPVRWRVRQKGTDVRIAQYAMRDLKISELHGW